jgi:hypothetical protein
VKALCPACERFITLDTFRMEERALIVTCTRCGVQTRVDPSSEPLPTPSPPSAARATPRVSLASSGATNVVVLRTSSREAIEKAAESVQEPFHIPPGVCPRCITRKTEAASCPQCGIFYANFDPRTVLPDEWLRGEWVELLRDWGNEAKHSALRRQAQQGDALAAIGRLYRLRQAAVPEDPIATEGLKDVLRLAAVPIGVPREREDVSRRRTNAVLATVLVVGGGLVVLILQIFK